MRATFLIIGIVTLLYFVLSPDLLFIPQEALQQLGFSISNPKGIFTYSFIHVTPQHLLSNMIFLALVGLIAERKFTRTDYLLVYSAAVAFSAIAYVSLEPKVLLVGASAGIAAILAAAALIDIKRTVIYVVAFVLLVPTVLMPVLSYYTQSAEEQVSTMTTELEAIVLEKQQELVLAEEKLRLIAQNISTLQDQFIQGRISADVFESRKETLDLQITQEREKIGKLEKQAEEMGLEIKESKAVQENLATGREREKLQPPQFMHLFGAIIAVIYIIVFRRDILWEVPLQVSFLTNYLQRSAEKSKTSTLKRSSRSRQRRSSSRSGERKSY